MLIVLTLVQMRWIYYANLTELLLVARYFQIAPLRWTRWVVVAVFLFAAAYDNAVEIQQRRDSPDLELSELQRD